MIDRRKCDDCIFHDGHCRRWDCKYISRESAEKLLERQTTDAVSREAVKNMLWNIIENLEELQPVYQQGYINGVNQMVKELEAERHTGEWVRWCEVEVLRGKETHIQRCKCSKCNNEVEPDFAPFWNFCPYCGTNMRGEIKWQDMKSRQQ